MKAGEKVEVLAFEDLNGNDEWWQCRNKQGEEGAVWVLGLGVVWRLKRKQEYSAVS